MNTNHNPTNNNQGTHTMNTHTFTYPSFEQVTKGIVTKEQRTTHHDYVAEQFFISQNGYPAVARNAYRCNHLDMARYFIRQEAAIIVKSEGAVDPDSLMTTMVHTVEPRWFVWAPMLGSDTTRIAMPMGSHGHGLGFVTELEAITAAKKMKRTAEQWCFELSVREQNADAARIACSVNPDDMHVRLGTDQNVKIGDWMKFHGMGKYRVGVVTGQTATKWVLAYTTPSNPLEIRTKKISKS